MNAILPFPGGPDHRALPPPHNAEAEQALLGAILVENACARAVMGFVRPEHFHEEAHGRIYAACIRLVGAGEPANPVTLRTYFEHDDALKDVGKAGYLARLAGAAVTLHHVEHYGRVVVELATRRSLMSTAAELGARAADPSLDEPAPALVDEAIRRLSELRGDSEVETGTRSLMDVLAGALKAIDAATRAGGQITGLTTGLRDVDEAINGYGAGELVVLAARPAMGKTALALLSLIAAGKAGASAIKFSMEMDGDPLAQRIVCAEAWEPGQRIQYRDAARGRLPRGVADMRRLVAADARLTALPIAINVLSAPSCGLIRIEAERFARRMETRGHKLGLVVVDHLGLVGEPHVRGEPEAIRLGRVTKHLKKLARDLGCAVLLLCQLNRGLEAREDKRPTLADLRDSGHIEQDADKVLFLYRPEYYLERARPDEPAKISDWEDRLARARGRAELIVGKQRNGATPRVNLMCDIGCNVFRDLGEDPAAQGEMALS